MNKEQDDLEGKNQDMLLLDVGKGPSETRLRLNFVIVMHSLAIPLCVPYISGFITFLWHLFDLYFF